MQVRCACGVHTVDPEHSNYVKNGVPMCAPWTCQKVREHANLARAPHFDDIEHDRLPSTIHAKDNYVVNVDGQPVPYDLPADCYAPESI